MKASWFTYPIRQYLMALLVLASAGTTGITLASPGNDALPGMSFVGQEAAKSGAIMPGDQACNEQKVAFTVFNGADIFADDRYVMAQANPPVQRCGRRACPPGMVCCNPSCGICTAPGGVCTQQVCEQPGR